VIDLRDRIPSGYTGRFIIPDLEEVEGIAIHHSVSGWVWNPLTQRYTCHWNDAVDVDPRVEVAHLLAIDRWHSPPNNDFGGFGYHLAAFASGRWYLCGSLNTVRAHVVDLNSRFNGLVLIGDFSNAVPRESHLEAAREGVAFIRAFHGRTLPVEAHRLIRRQNTTCPGEEYYKWVPGLNEGSAQEEETMSGEMTWALHLANVERNFDRVRAAMVGVRLAWPRTDREKAALEAAKRTMGTNDEEEAWRELIDALADLDQAELAWRRASLGR